MHHAAEKEPVTVTIADRTLHVFLNHKKLMQIGERDDLGNFNTPAERLRQSLEILLLGVDNRWNQEAEGGVPTEDWLSENIDMRDLPAIARALEEAMGIKKEAMEGNGRQGASHSIGSTSGPSEPST